MLHAPNATRRGWSRARSRYLWPASPSGGCSPPRPGCSSRWAVAGSMPGSPPRGERSRIGSEVPSAQGISAWRTAASSWREKMSRWDSGLPRRSPAPPVATWPADTGARPGSRAGTAHRASVRAPRWPTWRGRRSRARGRAGPAPGAARRRARRTRPAPAAPARAAGCAGARPARRPRPPARRCVATRAPAFAGARQPGSASQPRSMAARAAFAQRCARGLFQPVTCLKSGRQVPG